MLRLSKSIAAYSDARKEADFTPEDEYYLGRAVAAEIIGKYSIYRDEALQTYLNMICAAIVINSPIPDIYNGYHVAILDTGVLNAFSTPGGHILITRGLIACAPSEDALAAVIAHAIAHIQLRHAMTVIRNARYVNTAISGILTGLAETSGNKDTEDMLIEMEESTKEIISTLIEKGYSKKQELDADVFTLSLLAAANYKPSGLLEMLEILQQETGNNGGYYKNHATPEERIAEVTKNLRKYKVTDTPSYRNERFVNIIRQEAIKNGKE